jgi:tRNA-specific 2-thiouridylase
MKTKVVAAMSGGVDSSVAAYLLKEQGYEVIGLTMDLFDVHRLKCGDAGTRSCCGWKAKEDANRVAAALGIAHYVADFRREFEENVVADFCGEYVQGRTPNPCVRCNEHIKFRALLERAGKLGADFIATGHYARITRDARPGRYCLRKGADKAKDQSYFLYTLTQSQMARTLFPVGDLAKADVRRIAREQGLPVAEKPESQEVCFVPDDDYAGFVAARCPEAMQPGPILDSEGRVLGTHAGIVRFTVGQRKGMGISAPRPLYVLAIDPARRAVIVGPNEELYRTSLIAGSMNFVCRNALNEPVPLKARIRYRHSEAEALVTPGEAGRVRVDFSKPQRAITPGQSVVFYDDDSVVGGGLILSAVN